MVQAVNGSEPLEVIGTYQRMIGHEKVAPHKVLQQHEGQGPGRKSKLLNVNGQRYFFFKTMKSFTCILSPPF